MSKINLLKRHLKEKRCVKVIAGINNFDIEKIKRVVSAADQANASAVDIAARKDIIYITKEICDIPVFVSSINPQELAMAACEGADVLEVGNYDALYSDGLRITDKEVLNIVRKTLDLVGNDVVLSVTVPGHIDIGKQIKLAQQLEEMGVDMIQTEGAVISNAQSSGARGLIEKAHISISNTIELARNVDIPIITASGITVTTASLAVAAGASGVGMGSCINRLNSTIEMIAVIRATVESLGGLIKQESLA